MRGQETAGPPWTGARRRCPGHDDDGLSDDAAWQALIIYCGAGAIQSEAGPTGSANRSPGHGLHKWMLIIRGIITQGWERITILPAGRAGRFREDLTGMTCIFKWVCGFSEGS